MAKMPYPKKMVKVRKMNGIMEEYDESKLRHSLARSGADPETIDKILAEVKNILHDGIETGKLFKFVLKEFKKYQPNNSARYTLKRAILRLGPRGFAFEKYISRILEEIGYTTKLNQAIHGEFISHEVDITAERKGEKLMVECKHHTKPWNGCTIQTALYIYARFLDVKNHYTAPMLVTNTRFSPQLITYAKGVGLKLMGWKYPPGEGLEHHADTLRLYPVTMLHELDDKLLNILLKKKIVLVRTLKAMSVKDVSKLLPVSEGRARKIHEEATVYSLVH